MDWNKSLAEFEDYLVNKGQSQGTIHVYLDALRRWFGQLNGTLPTKGSAQEYINKLARSKSASTANLRARAIMRWFRWRGAPITLDCPTIPAPEPRYIKPQQIKALLAKCRTPLELAIIAVLFDTGVRVSELLNLKLSGIDRENMLITVVRKGGRVSSVNISDKALYFLDAFIQARESNSEYVFMGMSYQEAWRLVKRLGKKIKVDLSPHMLRHSRAFHMLMNNTGLHVVKEHLGHVNIATTSNIYGRFRAVDMKDKIPKW